MKEKLKIAGLLALMALVWGIGLRLDDELNRTKPSTPFSPDQISVLFKGKTLKALSLGCENAFADYMFLKLIQYVEYREDNYKPLTDVKNIVEAIAELDPKFDYVYRYAWIHLTTFDKRPQEIYIREAGDILREGWKNSEQSVALAQDLGFHYFFYEGDFENSAKMYEKAAELKPEFHLFKLLASSLRAQSGQPEAAAAMLRQQIATAADPDARAIYENKLRKVEAEIIARKLDEAVEAYLERNGVFPKTIDDLVRSGLISSVPPDGMGGTYRWNPKTSEVESTTFGRMKVHISEIYSPPWKKK